MITQDNEYEQYLKNILFIKFKDIYAEYKYSNKKELKSNFNFKVNFYDEHNYEIKKLIENVKINLSYNSENIN